MEQNKKQQYIELLTATQRKGMDKLLAWLESTDFFTAPASTRFHGAYEGGLLEHSMNVYNAFQKLFPDEEDPASVAICTLLHDLCKANFYAVEYRNKKNSRGEWEKVPVYVVEDQFPYGHGEKSVYLIEHFVRLKKEEAFAIGGTWVALMMRFVAWFLRYGQAFEKFPLAVKLHMADMYASYLIEARGPQEQTH